MKFIFSFRLGCKRACILSGASVGRKNTARIIAKSINSTFVGDIVGGFITSELLIRTTITCDRI